MIIAALILFLAGNCNSAEIGINFYGKSFHFEDSDKYNNSYNENNYGFGVIVNYYQKSNKEFFIEFGTFKDSYKNQSKYMSTGFKYKLLPIIKIGAQIAVYSSISVQGNIPVITPIITIYYDRISVNSIFLPTGDREHSSESYDFDGAIGIYANIILFKNL